MKSNFVPALVRGAALLVLLSTLNPPPSAFAQGTAFTYQGRLNDGASPANGSYDLTFALFSVSNGVGQIGATLTNTATVVSNGLFTLTLDFGASFPGADRWLEIGVRTNGGGAFSTLTPRQKLTPAPYAIYSANAGSAGNVAGNFSGDVSGTQGVTVVGSVGGYVAAAVASGASAANAATSVAMPGTIVKRDGLGNFSANAITAASFSGNGSGLSNVNAATIGGLSSSGLWQTGGNAGTAPGANFVGTSDNQPLELKVNGSRALRLEPTANDVFHSNIVNVIGGSPVNFVAPGVYGATIGGGGAAYYFGGSFTNKATADFATVSGGYNNTASSTHATVGGGINNIVGGINATIPGGSACTAAGDYSFAAGRRAKANQQGSFVWCDSLDQDGISQGTDTFTVRASGGVYLFTSGGATGVQVGAGGGSWSSISDRNVKENFQPVDSQDVLARVTAMPLTSWNYKTQDKTIRHIGPMAQDFYAAFNVGEDEKHITTVDADGVALAAIQGLNQKLEEERAENAELKERLEKLERLMSERKGESK